MEPFETCFGSLSHIFSVRGCVAKEYRTLYVDENLHFVDDVGFAYSDQVIVGPKKEDLTEFLSGCPELSHKSRNMTLLCLSGSCLEHLGLVVIEVSIGSSSENGDGPALSDL